jgi:hypothetical protein
MLEGVAARGAEAGLDKQQVGHGRITAATRQDKEALGQHMSSGAVPGSAGGGCGGVAAHAAAARPQRHQVRLVP